MNNFKFGDNWSKIFFIYFSLECKSPENSDWVVFPSNFTSIYYCIDHDYQPSAFSKLKDHDILLYANEFKKSKALVILRQIMLNSLSVYTFSIKKWIFCELLSKLEFNVGKALDKQ